MSGKVKKSVKGNAKVNLEEQSISTFEEQRLINVKKRIIELMTLSLDGDLTSEQLEEQAKLLKEQKELSKSVNQVKREEEKKAAIFEASEYLKNNVHLLDSALHDEGQSEMTAEFLSMHLGTLKNIISETKKLLPSKGKSNYVSGDAESTEDRELREYQQAVKFIEEGNTLKDEKPMKRMYRAYNLFQADAAKYEKLISEGKKESDINDVIKRRYIAVNNLIKKS